MVGILRREQCETLAVEADTIQMRQVGVLVFLSAVRYEKYAAILLVHIFNSLHNPWTLGHLILQLAGFAVVKIEMIPAVALRTNQNFAGSMHVAKERLAWIHVLIGMLTEQNFLFAGHRINDPKFLSFYAPIIIVVVDGLTIREPIEAGPVLKRQLQGIGFNLNALAGLKVKNNRLSFGQHLAR